MKTQTEQIKELKKEIKQLKKQLKERTENSIGWSVEDFLEYDQDEYTLTRKQAKAALADMMRHADASIGITWDTVYYYIQEHGTERK